MSKYTHKAIMDSFLELLHQKSLDKITVKDIIESAEINRNTFYYHFEDIYDLLEKTFQYQSEKYRSEASPDNTFYQEYVRLVEFFQAHRDGIMHIYNSKSREVLMGYLESSTTYFVSEFVKRAAEGTKLSEKGEEYIVYFYSYAIIGATLLWINRRMPDYNDNLIRTVAASFEATIDDMIQSYIDLHPEECR